MSAVDLAGLTGGAATDAVPLTGASVRRDSVVLAGARVLTAGLAKDARVGAEISGGADSDPVATFPVEGPTFGAGDLGETGEGELA
jgi:hypothetical protein